METLEQRILKAKTPLQYDKYKEYYIDDKNNDTKYWKRGIHQWVFHFENNYGASVIKHFGSYGYDEDLFELAVIKFNNVVWDLCYDTPITSDVIGNLTNDEILELLERIKNL